ncbi:50S ribosomal protein L6 [Enterobacteriaceae endosymbiont of Macroplea appendiculata]|uniref:50S ribosomal protein L6 n=1 Tax=Enterobacteriaceae endosymbiont of Macroplea appendiculata TaxID=2675790 RepID=UPI001449FC7A|nr:50S ribosomal protein L6 [Enterobacteriaceae endosymbiont of Macroplea appendiculata]QJC30871.1 50S ribosomal protein L6 [Enterobacteriaceae endosymbiont of Macroplea appendiculata]
MSRIAKKPIIINNNIEVTIHKQTVTIIGNKSFLKKTFHISVQIILKNQTILFLPRHKYVNAWAHAGTARSIVNSMIIGVTQGFMKKLILSGIGYKATLKDNTIHLLLGFSHPILYKLPNSVVGKCVNQNEIILHSFDKQLLGQVASDIRAHKPPEPYKGKGIRYDNEKLIIKETKKK